MCERARLISLRICIWHINLYICWLICFNTHLFTYVYTICVNNPCLNCFKKEKKLIKTNNNKARNPHVGHMHLQRGSEHTVLKPVSTNQNATVRILKNKN